VLLTFADDFAEGIVAHNSYFVGSEFLAEFVVGICELGFVILCDRVGVFVALGHYSVDNVEI
jgi:hypothetical protein